MPELLPGKSGICHRACQAYFRAQRRWAIRPVVGPTYYDERAPSHPQLLRMMVTSAVWIAEHQVRCKVYVSYSLIIIVSCAKYINK
eukprot:6929546-Pyramimonas_sp.AAC.1